MRITREQGPVAARPPVVADKTALITGASGGIGSELAELFARDGYDLVLVARSKERLASVASRLERQHGVSVRTLAKDLSRPEAPAEILAELDSDSVVVDVLVNNAGFGVWGLFAEASPHDQAGVVDVNVAAVTNLTRLVLPGMLERGQGKILNVGSVAGFQPGPLMAVYAATKAYVLSFSEALANELAGSGVTVTALCPGPTETGFSARAGMQGSRLFQGPTMDAQAVARAGYRALMRGSRLTIPGLRNRALVFFERWAPRRSVPGIARRIFEPVKAVAP